MILEELRLFTSSLPDQWAFYTNTLGMKGQREGSQSFSLQAGATRLVFAEREGQPYYHFAFNIPPYQYEPALEWLKQRAPILRDGDAELIDFSNWNAFAMYFHDPAGNIVEFIARRDLAHRAEAPFSAASILSVSEIGLPVRNVRESFEFLHRKSGLPFYSGNCDNFCAAGDPQGLFIIVDPRNKQWYPTEMAARSFPLTLTFREREQSYVLTLEKEQLWVRKA